ncbi:MAG: helix-turn-helix transcriptional regulator [Gaiellales bacterium]
MATKKQPATYSTEPLGPTIEKLMAATGVTYRALADKTGLSAGYLNHIVHGNRPVPSNEVLAKLAKALGVKADHFREYRVRVITAKLETMPEMVERLYKKLSSS